MAVTTGPSDSPFMIPTAGTVALTPDSLAQALSRLEVARGRDGPRPYAVTSQRRLLVVDGHPVLREGLLALVEREPDIDVCGIAAHGDAVEAVRDHEPGVVLVDVSVSESNGIETTGRILRGHPEARVLCFSSHADRHQLAALLEAGAFGYLLWSAQPDEVLMAIRAVAAGQTYLSPAVTGDLVRDFVTHRTGGGAADEPHLTPREYEVLQLIAEGLGTGQVAARLSISPKTVNTHREHIMAKLDLHTDVALCRYALRSGVVTDDLDLT